jgi:hypothetical protein
LTVKKDFDSKKDFDCKKDFYVFSLLLAFKASNGNSKANLSSANFANVASTRVSTRGRVFGVFCVDVVTRQAVSRGLARLANTRYGKFLRKM